ncbi:hypothetical protein [Paenibacillus polymyxa]|uniref:hypothetical protein n=1 Tax=Paenibacillus polymyxa TaxID=1406 RepID=UPI00287F92E3|nr:hypothetical protein [Paenibacillus polymyxa]
MSGYIRQQGELPKDFLKVENVFREDLNSKFEEGFHTPSLSFFINIIFPQKGIPCIAERSNAPVVLSSPYQMSNTLGTGIIPFNASSI